MQTLSVFKARLNLLGCHWAAQVTFCDLPDTSSMWLACPLTFSTVYTHSHTHYAQVKISLTAAFLFARTSALSR